MTILQAPDRRDHPPGRSLARKRSMTQATSKRRGATYELERGYRRMIIPAILAVAIFAIVPLAGMLALSFSDYHLIRGSKGEFGFHNFARLLSDQRLVNSIYVMSVLSIFGVAAQVVIGTAERFKVRNENIEAALVLRDQSYRTYHQGGENKA